MALLISQNMQASHETTNVQMQSSVTFGGINVEPCPNLRFIKVATSSFKLRLRGWADCSAIKSATLSEDPVPFQAPTWGLTIICNSGSEGSDNLLWTLKASDTYMMYRQNTCIHLFLNKNTQIKLCLKNQSGSNVSFARTCIF